MREAVTDTLKRKVRQDVRDLDRIDGSGEGTSKRLPASEEIPPIVLRDKSWWLSVSAEIKRCGYNYTKARSTRKGVRFFFATETDFRGITNMLVRGSHPLSTAQRETAERGDQGRAGRNPVRKGAQRDLVRRAS